MRPRKTGVFGIRRHRDRSCLRVVCYPEDSQNQVNNCLVLSKLSSFGTVSDPRMSPECLSDSPKCCRFPFGGARKLANRFLFQETVSANSWWSLNSLSISVLKRSVDFLRFLFDSPDKFPHSTACRQKYLAFQSENRLISKEICSIFVGNFPSLDHWLDPRATGCVRVTRFSCDLHKAINRVRCCSTTAKSVS